MRVTVPARLFLNIVTTLPGMNHEWVSVDAVLGQRRREYPDGGKL